jgi:hypothetical protein
MGVQWPEESHYAKEMKRWDAPKREGGMNRNGFEPYPKMLYRTQPHPQSGRHEISMDKDIISLDKTVVLVDAQAFNNSCQLIVHRAEEEENAKRDGWRESQAEAVQFHLDELDRMAREAAHRNHDDRNLSEKAKAEARAIEEKIPGHVAEIPEQPRVKRSLSPEALQSKRDAMAKAREAKAKKKAAAQGA